MRLIIPLLIVLSSCSGKIYTTIQSLPAIASSQSLPDSLNITVLVFLDVDCPISQYVIKPLNALQTEYKDQIEVIGIVPGTYYTNQELQDFATEFDVQFSSLIDPNLKLVKRLDAHITPEVFVLDRRGRILYQGAVDDKYLDLGKSKPLPNQSYLDEALCEFIDGNVIRNPKTEAIGCIIER
jgi:predicted glycosyltransferase involved in capsule biosynthesis